MINPWGTPYLTLMRLLFVPFKSTHCRPPLMKDWNHNKDLPRIPVASNLGNRDAAIHRVKGRAEVKAHPAHDGL